VQQENNSPVLTVEAIVRQLFFFFQIFPFTGHGERVQLSLVVLFQKSKI
jgi:hypothetical protein